jgi:hypothetical protein
MRKTRFPLASVLLGLFVMPAAAFAQSSESTVTTRRGGSISTTRSNTAHDAAVTTTVTTAAGKTGSKSKAWNKDTHTGSRSVTGPSGRSAGATTTIDANPDDNRVGVSRTVTGPNGRTAAASRSTVRDGDAIVHEATRTGFQGRTASRQGVFTEDSRSHTRTNRRGQTRTWSRGR